MAYFIRSYTYNCQFMTEILTSRILNLCKENPNKNLCAVVCATWVYPD